MIDYRTLYPILYVILSLVTASSRLVIRDIPNLITPKETPDSLFEFRQLSGQSFEVKDAVATTAFHGSTNLGYYFATLYFGTPSQPQTLIVDTGSTITTVPCNECGNNCGTRHFSEFFKPEESTSFTELKCNDPFGRYVCQHCAQRCDFSISYSEGSSYRGNYKKDYVSFNNYSNGLRSLTETSIKNDIRVYMPFGCTVEETNLFLTQEADGIFGLGISTNSYAHPPNIIDALKLSDDSVSNAFSICAGQQGGYLAVGGYNKTYHTKSEEPQYVPYDGNGGQYRVHWNDVQFNGQKLDLSSDTLNRGRGAYIDSGTTMFYTTSEIADKMNGAIDNFCSSSKKHCGGIARQDNCWYHDSSIYHDINDFFATFGTFTFDLGNIQNAAYEWKPEDYLFRYSDDQNFYCTGIDSLGGGRTIFGGTFMKNHDILFDKDNSQIGFVRSDCSAGYTLASYPKSRVSDHIHEAEEVNYIPEIIFYGAFILLILMVLSICLSKCKNNGLDDKDQDSELEVSPQRKPATAYKPMTSARENSMFKDNTKGYQEIPEEFSI